MTEELAGFLYEHNASVMGKLDSLRPEVQDYLAGGEGAFEDIKTGLENLINRMNLGKIYDSDIFAYVMNIDKVLEGRCGNCEHMEEYIGCRGYAYSVGVNNGVDPFEALKMECKQCFKE
ncbi:MAG: hypothetical protein PHF18_09350 [Methanosarcina sp.]|uniref:hypothetical protein n=1 Tax=Methanosarcina sp. TaxID=2213 RepID=UPI00261058D2|nr:hypothetical protein [Methanosarcina sp.]MDD3247038.1 hypothetical protein [Methanosarcina sp.]